MFNISPSIIRINSESGEEIQFPHFDERGMEGFWHIFWHAPQWMSDKVKFTSKFYHIGPFPQDGVFFIGKVKPGNFISKCRWCLFIFVVAGGGGRALFFIVVTLGESTIAELLKRYIERCFWDASHVFLFVCFLIWVPVKPVHSLYENKSNFAYRICAYMYINIIVQ